MLDTLTMLAGSASAGVTTPWTIDISEGTSESATAIEMGKTGIPRDCWFLVHLMSGSSDAIAPLVFQLEVSEDAGSTYDKLAEVRWEAASAVADNEIKAIPVGPIDFRVDKPTAPASLLVRVTATYADTVGTVDPTCVVCLAGPQSQNPFGLDL